MDEVRGRVGLLREAVFEKLLQLAGIGEAGEGFEGGHAGWEGGGGAGGGGGEAGYWVVREGW